MSETARALTCPQCGGTIALRAAGSTVTLVCAHCGSMLDMTRPDIRVIVAATQAMSEPEIALGTRGTVDGLQWEVIGYLRRSDDYDQWSEYLLFNPYEGYAFLIDDGRRFSFGRLLDAMPGMTFTSLELDGQTYSRFGEPYTARVTFVVGEFYWRVAVGEEAQVTDFVRPGATVYCEKTDQERTWTLARLLDRGVAERAFGIDPRPSGIGGTPSPHEPSPYRRLLWEALAILAVACVALVIISGARGGSRELVSATLDAQLDGAGRSAVLGPFRLAEPYNVVSIRAQARTLDNAWVELDYSLVDTATQESFDAYTTAEYYHGRDSDGNWGEGDWTPEVNLASIPAGTYQLVVDAAAKRWVQVTDPSFYSDTPREPGAAVPVEITVRRGAAFGSNIPLALLIMAIWPAALTALHLSFEKRRMAPVTDDE